MINKCKITTQIKHLQRDPKQPREDSQLPQNRKRVKPVKIGCNIKTNWLQINEKWPKMLLFVNLKQQILGREPKVYQKYDSRESNNYKQHNKKRKVISIETENYGFLSNLSICCPWAELVVNTFARSGCGWRRHLVSDLDEETEALGGFEHQTSGDVVAEVFGFRARLHLKHLWTQT